MDGTLYTRRVDMQLGLRLVSVCSACQGNRSQKYTLTINRDYETIACKGFSHIVYVHKDCEIYVYRNSIGTTHKDCISTTHRNYKITISRHYATTIIRNCAMTTINDFIVLEFQGYTLIARLSQKVFATQES